MNALDTFYRITGYDLAAFFKGFSDFVSQYYSNYIGYYTGNNDLDRSGVDHLKTLKLEADIVEELFDLNKDSLSYTIELLQLYDDFTSVKVKIETTLASPKWMRASYVSDFDRNINVDQILRSGQSVEDLASDLGYISPNDDWVKLAVDNTLSEIDYDGTGGNLLKVSFSNNSNINTTSVVDVMVGENVLGKDLPTKISIVDNDLYVLQPKQTLSQAAGILISVVRGSVPEFPEDGIPEDIVGSNINLFQYPVVFRQLTDIFRKDDTFKEIEAIGVKQENESVDMQVRIVSKLNDVLNENIYING